MLIFDFKKDFYQNLLQQRVVIFCSIEVDSVAACKILLSLFHTDSVSYSLIPVFTLHDLEDQYLQQNKYFDIFILINCGANFDLVELLSPEEKNTFFVIDYRRPLALSCIYTDQFKILVRESESVSNIPEVADLAREDSESEQEEDPDDENEENLEPTSKRTKFDEGRLLRKALKRKEKREWELKRERLLHEYFEYEYYSVSSSELLFELAWRLSKDSNLLLWFGIVGMTDHWLNHKITKTQYCERSEFLGIHVRRLNAVYDNQDDNAVSVDCMKISSQKELKLHLYKHWSLWDSCYNTLFVYSHFKLWSLRGQRKYQDFLVHVGLSLRQCKQKFSALDTKLKSDITQRILTAFDKLYKHRWKTDFWFGSYAAQYGLKHQFSALDIVFSIKARLEKRSEDTAEDRFFAAMDSLSYRNCDVLSEYISHAKHFLQQVSEQINNVLATSRTIHTGPFLVLTLTEDDLTVNYFQSIEALQFIGRSILTCLVANSPRYVQLPLVLIGPCLHDPQNLLISGFIPIAASDETTNNFFGRAFEQAAERCSITLNACHFEQSVVEINSEDKLKFMDSLITLLK